MKKFSMIVLATTAAALLAPTASAAPVVLGLANKHPLSEARVGRLLMGELRCFACHGDTGEYRGLERAAPDLSEVGARVAPGFLRRMIASPAEAHPGTTMPDVLAAETPERKDKIAEAITHYLVSRSPRPFVRKKAAERDGAAGKALYHSVGCVACHSAREGGKEVTTKGVVGLGHLGAKYSLPSLGEFLFQPGRVRPSGRMPDVKLTPAEADAIAGYLLAGADATPDALEPIGERAALGKTYFQQFNCAACHKLGDGPPAAPLVALRGRDLTRGCLSDRPGKAPRFGLSGEQTRAIRAALSERAEPPSDKVRLAATLTAFNCIACHVRDEYGGVSAENNPAFQGSEKELGDEGRIPPPLTLVGAKLRPASLKKVLFDGEAVRPYAFTRMPQFGEANLRDLPGLFARLDSVKAVAFSMPSPESGDEKERERERTMRAAGRELVGDKALYCIACHSFNGKAPNRKGIDLVTFPQRLQPGWFSQFLRDPSAFRPRTVMPAAWPGGKAVQTTILHGDTDRQIEAIWYYLSLGTSAADPSGVRNVETTLAVTDATRTYRGRSSVAGYRGIAVGFPEKLSYAFNAETGTLSAIWRGDFVRVDRGGQGSGGFHPAGGFVALAQDVSFFALPTEDTPWPLRPVMTGESPVNPDPLYPKNRGYQFKGYSLDDDSIPTFAYRSGTLAVEDRSAPDPKSKKGGLVRRLAFDSPEDRAVWFRALTGKVEAESERQFKTAELRLTVPPGRTLLRPAAGGKGAAELLLEFKVPKGKSTRTLTYELLR